MNHMFQLHYKLRNIMRLHASVIGEKAGGNQRCTTLQSINPGTTGTVRKLRGQQAYPLPSRRPPYSSLPGSKPLHTLPLHVTPWQEQTNPE